MNIIYPKITSDEMKKKVEKVERLKPKDYAEHKRIFSIGGVIFLHLSFIILLFLSVLTQSPVKVLFIILSIFGGLVVLISNLSIIANGFKKEPTQTLIEIVYDKLFPQMKEADVAYKKLLFNVQRCSNLIETLTRLQEQKCEIKQLSSDTLMIKYEDGPDTIHISPDVCRCEGETLDFTPFDGFIAKLSI